VTGTLAVATVPNCTWFEVAYVGADGVGYRGSLAGCWTARFEDALPVRSFPAFKGQGNFPGWWWSSTMDRHVGYESWLERDLNRTLRRVVGSNVARRCRDRLWM
jgi:hypothetical protein